MVCAVICHGRSPSAQQPATHFLRASQLAGGHPKIASQVLASLLAEYVSIPYPNTSPLLSRPEPKR
jgi:hypothetical protein